MLSKNQEYEIHIEDMSSEGAGVGRIQNIAVFVEQGLPGEVLLVRLIKINANRAYGKLQKIIKPSPHRIAPPCPAFPRCGGCVLQHCAYDETLRLKQKKVADALLRIGGVSGEQLDILGMEDPFFYRNKAQFPAGFSQGEPIFGFYASRSHRVVPVDRCLLQHPAHEPILRLIKNYIKECQLSVYDEISHTGTLRHAVIRTGMGPDGLEIMVGLVINGSTPQSIKILERSLFERIDGMKTLVVNTNTQRGNVIFGTRTESIAGSGVIRDCIGSLCFEISPTSFYQVNARQTKRLYDTVLAFAEPKGHETAIDAYCGIGTISLALSRRVSRVYGVEISQEAVKNAKRNAMINDIRNVTFTAGAAEEKTASLARQTDILILDPPRKGCAPSLLRDILAMAPPKLVYVSCDPATLARDSKILCEGGYRLGKVKPIDMFPQTAHVETVALLTHEAEK